MRTKDLKISETKDIFVFKGTTSLYILCLYEGCSILVQKYRMSDVFFCDFRLEMLSFFPLKASTLTGSGLLIESGINLIIRGD